MSTSLRLSVALTALATLLALVGPGPAAGQDLSLDSSRTAAEIRPGGAETTTVTFTLTNTGSSDTSGVTVDVTVPAGLSVTSSSATSGSYSSGTWESVGVASADSAALDLTVSTGSTAPRDLAAALAGDSTVSTRARVVSVPYGSGTALAFDGDGDYVAVPGDPFINNTSFRKRTIEVWFRADELNSGSRQLIYDEGGGLNGLNMFLNGNGALRVGAWSEANGWDGDWLQTSAVEKNTWHHAVLVFDNRNNTITAYLDGEQFGSKSPGGDMANHNALAFGAKRGATKYDPFDSDFGGTGKFFEGRIDQVRLWDGALSQRQIQARAHRTIDLDGAAADSLIATFRLDAGSGSTAYVANGFGGTYPDGSFEGDPQWGDPSGASVGRSSTVLTDANSPISVGPSGSEIRDTIVAGTGVANSATVYRWGQAGDASVSDGVLPPGITERSNVTWGVWSHGSAESNAGISYGDVSGLTTNGSEPVQLLRRAAGDETWRLVTSDSTVTHDTGGNRFSVSGVTGQYQYAVANSSPPVDLALGSSGASVELLADGTESGTLTFTLENTDGSTDATGVTVDVSLPAGLTVQSATPSAGSYAGGTWDVGTVTAASSETLTLEVTLGSAAPQDVTAQVTASDQPDSDGAQTRTTVLPRSYGSGRALAFDGSDDFVAVPNDPSINTDGPYEERTIELWFRAADVDASPQVLFEEGGGGNGFNVYLRNGTLYAGGWSRANNWFGDWLSTTAVESGTWHHVALVFDKPNDVLTAYLDGERFGSTSPGSKMNGHGGDIAVGQNRNGTRFDDGRDGSTGERFEGRIDQVRLWDGALTQRQVQARAHRRIDLSTAAADSLIVAYRFDAGSGPTAYDVARFGGEFLDATLNGPQRVDPSGASVGRTTAVLSDANTPVSLGSTGSISASYTAGATGIANSAVVYRWGDASKSLVTDDAFPPGVSDRANVTWGLWSHGAAQTEATIDYSGVSGLTTDGSEPVQLLRRGAADSTWRIATTKANVTHDPGANQFVVSGVTGQYQYAVANSRPLVDLRLTASRSDIEIQGDGTVTTTLTYTLENTDGSDSATNVSVGVDVPSGVSISSSNASGSTSYGSGTWDVGDLSASTAETLTLEVTLNGDTPRDVAAQVTAADQPDPNGGAATARVIPTPYGSDAALAFDGSGDYVPTGAGGDDLGLVNESFSIDAWFKLRSTGDDRTLIGMDGGGSNEHLHLVAENQQVKFAFFSNDLETTSGPIQTGKWYHVAAVYDASKSDGQTDRYLYLNGEQVAADESTSDFKGTRDLLIGRHGGGNYFDGQIDQLRVWQGALSQRAVQARAHRTVDLDSTAASGLLAAYRLDAGTGETAYDVGNGDGTYTDGAFEGDPQWASPSGASVGRESTVLTDANTPVTVGPSGSRIEATSQSGTGLSGSTTVYRWGRADGSLVTSESFPLGVSDRLNVAWGLWGHGSAEADATIRYGGIGNLTTDGSEPVRLLRRPAPDTAWSNVTNTASVAHDTSANRFIVSGVTGRYQYAVANTGTQIDLALDASRSAAEIRPGGAEEATITLILSHRGGTVEATGVTVDVTVPAGLTVTGSSASAGSYSDSTWSGASVAVDGQETLELTVTLDDRIPASLNAQLTALDQMDGDGASTSARLTPLPYGGGQALAFDGIDDLVRVPNDDAINTDFSEYTQRTIELWFRADSLGGSTEQVLFEEGGGNNGFNVYLRDSTLYAGGWSEANGWGGTWLSTSAVEGGTWHHVALVFDQPDNVLAAYLDGHRVGDPSKSPGGRMDRHGGNVGIGAVDNGTEFKQAGNFGMDRGRYFEGRIDQARLWDAALSAEQVQARAHRTIDLDTPTADTAIVAYRFEAGRDSTVYDVAGFGGTFLNAETEGQPQWVPVSGARVGRASAVATGGQSATVGPTGGSVTADVSGDTLTVYQYGRTGGPLVDGTLPGEDFSGVGADRRLHLVWGLAPLDSATATVTFDFSRAQGVGDSTGVRLLKRDGPGATWTDVTNSWSFDAAAETFTKSGVTDFSQYAVAGDAESLPVELAQFTGRVTEEGVRLTWRTASEEGNAGFRIQRRGGEGANGNEGAWTRVGFVESKAEGGTDQPRSYRFVDADLPFAADSVRYRLKQVDVDGTARFSEPITVERGGVTTLRLKAPYPNPARDRATVPFAVPEGTDAESVQMRLYDVLGRRVRTVRASAEPGRHALRLDTGDLASGVYFLRLRAGETIRTRKVTVVR